MLIATPGKAGTWRYRGSEYTLYCLLLLICCLLRVGCFACECVLSQLRSFLDSHYRHRLASLYSLCTSFTRCTAHCRIPALLKRASSKTNGPHACRASKITSAISSEHLSLAPYTAPQSHLLHISAITTAYHGHHCSRHFTVKPSRNTYRLHPQQQPPAMHRLHSLCLFQGCCSHHKATSKQCSRWLTNRPCSILELSLRSSIQT